MLFTRRRLLLSGLAVSLARRGADAAAEDLRPSSGGTAGANLDPVPASLRLRPEPAAETPILAYNGVSPSPTLRLKLGEEARIILRNGLDQPTSLMWSGLRAPNAMDGVAGLTQEPVAPGRSFEYRFTPRDAGLFAYRPGYAPFAAAQLGGGLCGAAIVADDEPPEADRDLVAVLADWRLDEHGALAGAFNAREDAAGPGRIGEIVTVNSQPAPLRETLRPGARVRLRLVSAAAARIMAIAFAGVRPMILAVDGQPADAAFEPSRGAFPLGPGARFDILFDLPRKDGEDAAILLREAGAPDRTLIALRAEGEPRAALPPIASLPRNPLLPMRIALEKAKRAEFVIAPAKQAGVGPFGEALVWSVNGVTAPPFPDAPLFSVRRGAPATLALVNRSQLTQQIQIRGQPVRVLHDLDDGWEPYWRDAVLAPPGRTKRVAFVAGEPGRWAILSLIPDRLAGGLGAWFEVT